jgi:hypothetical protein
LYLSILVRIFSIEQVIAANRSPNARPPRRKAGGTVGFREILAQIDHEISQLKQARSLLRETRKSATPGSPKKRNLTPEGRRRIAEAVKRRWALQKKQARSLTPSAV